MKNNNYNLGYKDNSNLEELFNKTIQQESKRLKGEETMKTVDFEVKEVIKKQIKLLEEAQEDNKNFRISNNIGNCIALSVQINELVKTYLDIKNYYN